MKVAISRKKKLKKKIVKFFEFFFIELLIATNGATVHGSVLKMKFRVLSRKFESIETSPGREVQTYFYLREKN